MRTHRLALACLLLTACVFHDDDGPDLDERTDAVAPVREPSTRPVPKAEFCEQWARAACSDAVLSACQASDARECRQSQEGFCHDLVPGDIARSGRDACITAVAEAYRDADLNADELRVVLRFGGACARAVVGGRARGEPCSQTSECDAARGQACIRKPDAEMGTCQVPEVVDPGRDCKAESNICTKGFFCDGRNCIETLAAGEPCVVHEQCGQDGFCTSDGTCAERRAVNDACEDDSECAQGVCTELDAERVCTDRVLLSRADPLCATLR